MEEQITYGVYWKSDWNPNEFTEFFTWLTTYDAAYKEYKKVLKNPACHAARIVERTENYEIVAEKEAKHD